MLKQKSRRKARYKAIIVGAGAIGSGFDSYSSKTVLTHANGYRKNANVELLGFYDKDKKICQKVAKKWKTRAFLDFKEVIKAVPDIISVCVPDKFHYEILKKIILVKPKIVICEKPLTLNMKEKEDVIKKYKKAGISVLVNYSRRFDKKMQEFKSAIEKNKYGFVISASGIYTKGVIHNGSHLIDLARYFFGELKSKNILYSINDYKNSDKSIAGLLKFEKCPYFHLIVGDDQKYPIFELDMLFEKRRIRIFDFGFYYSEQTVINDPHFLGFKCLSKSKQHRTGLERAMENLIKNTIDYLDNKVALVCSGEEALRTEKTCYLLLDK